MSNLIAVLVHCRQRGSEVILGDQSHIHVYEAGGCSTLGGPSFAIALLSLAAPLRSLLLWGVFFFFVPRPPFLPSFVSASSNGHQQKHRESWCPCRQHQQLGVHPRTVPNLKDGTFDLKLVEELVRPVNGKWPEV